MAIEKINFSYPKGTLQGVFDTETLTALELASKTAKKVDECVDIVNAVEQTAISATAIVNDMYTVQNQFMAENADIRASIVAENASFVDSLEASKTTFEADLNASKTTFETNMTNAVNDIVANSETIVQTDVNTKVNAMIADGTIEGLINVNILNDVKADITSDGIYANEASGIGVINGLQVSAQPTPNMTVFVSAGVAHIYNGKRYVQVASVNQAIDPAHELYPRIDIIYISASGVLSYGKGTAISNPVALVPANGLVLAEIYVASGATTITAGNATDKRIIKKSSLQLDADIKNALNRFDSMPINAKTLGAVGDGVKDDTTALQNAITLARATGKSLFIPAGVYKVTASLIVNNEASINFVDNKKINIYGEGIQQTRIVYSGTGSCLSLLGGKTGTNNAMQSFQHIHDLTLYGTHTVGQRGLNIESCQGLHLSDVQICNFEYGVVGMDIDNATFTACHIHWNIYGIYMFEKSPRDPLASTRPNNINFFNCHIGNDEYGGAFFGATNVNFFGGSVQGCGINGTGPIRYGLGFFDGAVQGGVGCNINGVMFESNVNFADVWISNQVKIEGIPLPTIYNIHGCTFNRTQNTYVASTNIMTGFNEADFGKQKLVCSGNAFRNFTGAYTPDINRPHIYFGGDARTKDNCFFYNNMQSNDVEDVAETQIAPPLANETVGAVGEYKQIASTLGQPLSLPAGGKWKWSGQWVNNATGAIMYYGGSNAGVDVGGTQILAGQVDHVGIATIERIE